jgi:sucrose-6-phosphate hydrolase SacC (GH32 family)
VRRPVVHFAPVRGWINDPNGLVVHDGTWHLCFQHNPDGDTWGPMHWGHAVSADLVHWEPWPVALAPDRHGTVFSGSAVVDEAGTAGFGRSALVAVFTCDAPRGQSQAIAGSIDGGRTWTRHAANPVLAAPDGMREFRDPRVIRWAPGGPGAGDGHWVMALACGREIRLFRSLDLVAWEPVSVLPCEVPDGAIVETPDLVQLPTPDGSHPWVLTYGVLDRRPGGRSGTRYRLGTFDGIAFTPADPRARWADAGPDFYAAQSWTGAEPPVWVGWLSNWAYASELPSDGWRGTLSIPRVLSLAADGDGYRLVQTPVETGAAMGAAPVMAGPRTLDADERLALPALDAALDIRVVVDPEELRGARLRLLVKDPAGDVAGPAGTASVELATAPGGLRVEVARAPRRLRGPGAAMAWSEPATTTSAGTGPMEVRLLLDATSLEVFTPAGPISFVLAGAAAPWQVELVAAGGPVPIADVAVRALGR